MLLDTAEETQAALTPLLLSMSTVARVPPALPKGDYAGESQVRSMVFPFNQRLDDVPGIYRPGTVH